MIQSNKGNTPILRSAKQTPKRSLDPAFSRYEYAMESRRWHHRWMVPEGRALVLHSESIRRSMQTKVMSFPRAPPSLLDDGQPVILGRAAPRGPILDPESRDKR